MLEIVGLVICLLLMVWQDWKYRRIHVLLPVLLFGLMVFQTWEIFNYKTLAFNIVFFCLIFAFLVLYMSIKAKRFLNPFEHYFGLGDVMFYLAVTPFFMLREYAIYFIASMVFAIIMQTLFAKKTKEETVPLAGFSSLLLVMIIASDLLFNFPKLTLV